MGALWPGGVLSRIRTRYVVGASVGPYIRQSAWLACDSWRNGQEWRRAARKYRAAVADTGSEDEYDPRSTERWYKFVMLFIASFRQQCLVSYMRRLTYNIT